MDGKFVKSHPKSSRKLIWKPAHSVLPVGDSSSSSVRGNQKQDLFSARNAIMAGTWGVTRWTCCRAKCRASPHLLPFVTFTMFSRCSDDGKESLSSYRFFVPYEQSRRTGRRFVRPSAPSPNWDSWRNFFVSPLKGAPWLRILDWRFLLLKKSSSVSSFPPERELREAPSFMWLPLYWPVPALV